MWCDMVWCGVAASLATRLGLLLGLDLKGEMKCCFLGFTSSLSSMYMWRMG